MIYPATFEQKIEFDNIRGMILKNCLSNSGQEHVKKMEFLSDFETINLLLNQTEEFRQLLQVGPAFPSDCYFDLTPELERIKVPGSYIEHIKLAELKSSLATIRDVKIYINKTSGLQIPHLKSISDRLLVDSSIPARIEKILDDKGDFRDKASENLFEIRSKISQKLVSLEKKLRQALALAKSSGWVAADAEVTIRDGRAVIPLPVTHKRKIKGFILDESATGQTVYLEPGDVLEIQNEIRELQAAERREIIQILRRFSDFIRPHLTELIITYETLGIIDFIRSKALLALQIGGSRPVLKNTPLMQWVGARHPLLLLHHQRVGKEVIPFDLELNTRQRILVISGPNAGGKSVCLKTIALLQYMLQCGLLIPVKPESTTGIFNNLFIDIGDEQSLENDLSTYSSHLLNMKNFCLLADEHSLFFIDEFGSGTEPLLGGAIAEAVLENLNDKKSFGVITTHYANLKIMATRDNGIVNGAMLFDANKIEPLYQLKTGLPGSSFAFEIAHKIGFPEEILKNAENKSGKKQLDFEQLLQQIEIEKKEIERREEQIQVADDFLSEMIARYEKLLNELDQRKAEILSNAREEALEMIRSSNKLIENTIREIRESQAEKKKTRELRKGIEKQTEKIRKKVETPNEKKNSITDQPVPQIALSNPGSDKAIQPGDQVKVPSQNVTGEVISIKDGEVVIAINNMTFRTQLSNLVKDTPKTSRQSDQMYKTRYSGILENMTDKLANFKTQLDVRGKRGDEALDLVRQFIDDAILLNLREVRILHGKGYGILRNLIHEYLRGIPEVVSFRPEHVDFGGHGITIVIFK